MPGPLTQKPIDGSSLPLPATWAATVDLKDYWERKAEVEQLDPCEVDELEQGWLPGYDITDRYQ